MLDELHKKIVETGDETFARKIQELQLKLDKNRLEIALCGHFSAGKSSLLNFLCEKALLPTSPIPTSANLVRIAYGEPRIEVEMGDMHARSSHPLEIELLDEWCKNGEDIRAIEIYDHIPYLQEGLGLLDTPGIDSTDPAHKRATEAALHLADAVFYVMDYNHVQSEWNFSFVKELQDRNKPVVLIVNQIDKHRSEELSFEQFRESTKESFESWGIHPLAIMYVSVKVPSHPYSEWDRLKLLFNQLKKNTLSYIQNNISMSLEKLIVDHVRRSNPNRELEMEALEEVLNTDSAKQSEQLIVQLEAEKQLLIGEEDVRRTDWKKTIQTTLENANLTPSIVRDALEQLLNSLKPGFKLGLFSSQKKVELEQASRMEKFNELLNEHVESNAVIHLQKWIENEKIVVNKSDSIFHSPVTEDWILNEIGPVQAISGEFVLNISKKLAESVRKHLRQQGNSAIEQLIEAYKKEQTVKIDEIHSQLNTHQEIILKKQKRSLLKVEKQKDTELLVSLIPFQFERVSIELPASIKIDDKVTQQDGIGHIGVEESTSEKWIEQGFTPTNQAFVLDLAKVMNQVVDSISDVKWMDQLRYTLIERASRLENQSFVFALFGAFSAGKSSFANALLGSPILPVSPNPTTAAINKIVPVTSDHPHETAWISMKSEETLFSDVQYALNMLGYEVTNLSEALNVISKLKEKDIIAKAKPHFSFVKAVERGLAETSSIRGQRWLADLEQFRTYAANEWLSCFVEEIELAYDCPLTAAGVCLVDTPGADSIHARHTGVAFKFIKEADALFFVTYYNHAFSQADKEFLQQLGRVKDQFELDKMFFIINAADLASDEAERQTVISYVNSQLIANGVRNPRIFALSSMFALQAKLRKQTALYATSGMLELEHNLVQFVNEEIYTLAHKSGIQSLQHVINRIDDWLRWTNQDVEQKEQERNQIQTNIQLVRTWSYTDKLDTMISRANREMTELLFHVKNRIQFRFGDWFIGAFHPSLWATGSKEHLRILNQAWQEVVTNMSYALSQDMLATTLRIEMAIKQNTLNMYNELKDSITAVLPGYDPHLSEQINIATPVVIERIDSELVTVNSIARYFKNPKAFFEGEGRSQLRLDLEPKIEKMLSQYIELHIQEWSTHYKQNISNVFDSVVHRLGLELDMYEQSMQTTNNDEHESNRFEQLRVQLAAQVTHLSKSN